MSRSNLRCQPPPPAAGSLERDRDRRTGVRLRRLMGVALRDRLGDRERLRDLGVMLRRTGLRLLERSGDTVIVIDSANALCLLQAAKVSSSRLRRICIFLVG